MPVMVAHQDFATELAQAEILFGSVCSGISAASVSWNPLDWYAAWFHEIEKFPSSVLAARYPYAKNWGNMLQAVERIRSGEIVAPDVLCGGTPCQAFSIGGARRSLDDERGNLTLTYCEIANAIDERRTAEGLDECVVMWENVKGVLNTKDNAFGCLLAGLAGESVPLVAPGGKWPHAGVVVGPQRTVAWRVLDAKHFGLAQRRPRVFVVASARDGFDPAEVLFEWEGTRRDRPTGWDQERPLHPCLTASGGGSLDDREAYVLESEGVRRTTPVEWERCQGFPDNHTLIDCGGKPAADGPRYKAIGNSWAINCTRWLGERIQRQFKNGAAMSAREQVPLQQEREQQVIEINRTGDYVEFMKVRRVPAMHDTVEIRFESQLLTAKNPEELHLMRQFLVRTDRAKAMVDLLTDVLGTRSEQAADAAGTRTPA